jgi:hypothetical protein
MDKNKKGGKVIASGGFGCVFSPALKCKNKKRNKNKISKLMIKKNALDEYNEIRNLSSKLSSIPNYKNFFLISDFVLCEPDKLEETDLKNFKKKCTALPKKKITEKNINESLSEVLALNMPYGGVTVDDFIYDNISFENLIKLNNSLMKLLIHGIIPMNKKNIYHGDIKDSNILVEHLPKTKSLDCRLIDWGLSTEYKPLIESPFPSVWRNRPLQFNLPFSIILFTDDFLDKYTEYLEKGGLINSIDLKPFITDYIYYWLKTRGKGHYNFINNIMYMLYNEDYQEVKDEKIKTRIIESNITLEFISNYLIEILIHFTHFRENKTLNLRIYLDKVFIETIDIWGWITNYIPVLEILFENYSSLKPVEIELFEKIKFIFVHFMYLPTIKPIDINELIDNCDSLNNYFHLISQNNENLRENREEISKKSLGKKKSSSLGQNYLARILKSTKKGRLYIKNNKTKRKKYLLFADLKKQKYKK